LEIGFETACAEMSGVVFEDCDLIHNASVCLDIQNGDYAEVHGVAFRNLRVEYQKGAMPEIFQGGDGLPSPFGGVPVYGAGGRAGVPRLIYIGNPRFRESYAHLTGLLPTGKKGADGKIATVRGILFENISVAREDGVPMPASFIGSEAAGAGFSDIALRNIRIDGKRIRSAEELNMTVGQRVKGLTIE
jgi:hypothetical protein